MVSGTGTRSHHFRENGAGDYGRGFETGPELRKSEERRIASRDTYQKPKAYSIANQLRLFGLKSWLRSRILYDDEDGGVDAAKAPANCTSVSRCDWLGASLVVQREDTQDLFRGPHRWAATRCKRPSRCSGSAL